jgi:hypothetical protein
MVSDYYHGDYNHVIDPLLTPNLTDGGVWSQNNLINGRMHFDCANMTAGDDSTCHSDAPMSQFRFEKGKKHLLRLINSGGEALQRFSIDEHSMTIVANDFVPVEPYEAKVVFLSPGQRTDVIVEAAGDKSAYWMRSNITVGCSGSLQPNALAGVYYDDADASADPESIPWDISDPGLCQNDDLELSVPRHAVALPEADLELEIVYQWFYNSDWIFRFTANGIAFANDAADPSLLAANDGRTAFPEENNVINLGEAQSVRVVAYNNMSEP